MYQYKIVPIVQEIIYYYRHGTRCIWKIKDLSANNTLDIYVFVSRQNCGAQTYDIQNCFVKGTIILCFLNNFEVYIPIDELTKDHYVKT